MQHKDRLTDEERRERRLASARAYRERNREKCTSASMASRAKKVDLYREKDQTYKQSPDYQERQRQYRADNRQRLNAATMVWRGENKEKFLAYQAAYRLENRDKVMAKSVRWREENPERSRAQAAQWAKDNPESRRIAEHKRRAIKKNSGGMLSGDIYERLFERQKGLCACCRVDLKVAGIHLDHVMPLALGGPNTDDNAQLLCPPCNLSKGAKHPVDFMRQRGFLC